MLILSFESSCDETAVAVVEMSEDIKKIRSSIVASQIEMHKVYGGVVPEIASRAHIEAISNLTINALSEAGVTLEEIDVIAVANRPGLIGALLVGVNFAKSLAYANKKPIVAVNHIMGHIAANYLIYPDLQPPFFAFVASGGHTSLINVKSYDKCETVGKTRDDAIGEAFDKVARVMGLTYPGGAAMDKLAGEGDKNAVKFPSAAITGDNLDFSFSGLKTAAVNYIHNQTQKGEEINKADIAASFTDTIVRSVIKKLELAHEKYGFKVFALAGGVAANSHLRKAVIEFGEKKNIRILIPPLSLCGDNAAMIGAAGYYQAKRGKFETLALNAYATGSVDGESF